MPDGSLLSVLWLLICVVAVSGLAYWFTKFVVGRGLVGGAAAGKGGSLTVLAQISVGKDQRLLVVRAGERCFLLGATPAAISTLAEFTAEEAEHWKTPPPGETLPSFRESLVNVLKKH